MVPACFSTAATAEPPSTSRSARTLKGVEIRVQVQGAKKTDRQKLDQREEPTHLDR